MSRFLYFHDVNGIQCHGYMRQLAGTRRNIYFFPFALSYYIFVWHAKCLIFQHLLCKFIITSKIFICVAAVKMSQNGDMLPTHVKVLRRRNGVEVKENIWYLHPGKVNDKAAFFAEPLLSFPPNCTHSNDIFRTTSVVRGSTTNFHPKRDDNAHVNENVFSFFIHSRRIAYTLVGTRRVWQRVSPKCECFIRKWGNKRRNVN